ncbi:MAG: rod shape-determining protein MreC [Alphaproteobacteria bacterium]|nr:rod shape-determining protein MreC [Alphaproteobacteria bacterium]
MPSNHSVNSSYSFQIKSKLQRYALLLLVILSFGVMLIGKADLLIVNQVKTLFNSVATPFLTIIATPASYLGKGLSNIQELASIRVQNKKLREKNEKLNMIQIELENIRKENLYLSSLLNYVPPPTAKFTTTKIIGDTGSSFAQSLIAYVGLDQNIHKGDVVLTGDGLVGRVASVGLNAARIMLITDINSKIPVKVEPMDAPAILAGNNSETPELISLSNDVKVNVGDKIVTSGVAGVFPAGLPIGRIVSIDDGIIKIQPFADRNHLEIVRIVDYGLSGLLPETPCEQVTQ